MSWQKLPATGQAALHRSVGGASVSTDIEHVDTDFRVLVYSTILKTDQQNCSPITDFITFDSSTNETRRELLCCIYLPSPLVPLDHVGSGVGRHP